MKAQTIGYDISVPIDITMPSSVDMYLQVTAVPSDPKLIFNSTQILLPAFSSTGKLTFRYDGDIIPPTINVSLVLKSSYPLVHELTPSIVYFYFGESPAHNTLPTVMQVEVLHNYRNNSWFAGRKAYHINQTGYLFYDQLLPVIIQHYDDWVGSTSANVIVHTRE